MLNNFKGLILNRTKIISSAKWVLSTILVGALGSGLWEILISDLLSWFGLASLEVISYIFSGFRDTLYYKVSDGALVLYMKLPAMLAAIIFVSLPLFSLYKFGLRDRIFYTHYPTTKRYVTTVKNEDNSKGGFKKPSIINFRVSVLGAFVIAYAFLAFSSLYTARAANFIEKSMDIIAPHISNDKRLNLIATYRSVNDSESYMVMYSELKALEKELQIELPDFTPI